MSIVSLVLCAGPILLTLPALLVPLALLVWLPRRPYSQRSKLLLVIMLSFIALVLWGLPYAQTRTWGEWSWGRFLLLNIPLVAIGDLLLYFGGRARRFFGILAWVLAAMANVGVELYLCWALLEASGI